MITNPRKKNFSSVNIPAKIIFVSIFVVKTLFAFDKFLNTFN